MISWLPRCLRIEPPAAFTGKVKTAALLVSVGIPNECLRHVHDEGCVLHGDRNTARNPVATEARHQRKRPWLFRNA